MTSSAKNTQQEIISFDWNKRKEWTSTNDSGIQQLEGGQCIVNMWRISDKGASGSKFI